LCRKHSLTFLYIEEPEAIVTIEPVKIFARSKVSSEDESYFADDASITPTVCWLQFFNKPV
jgi:hypothetical protein